MAETETVTDEPGTGPARGQGPEHATALRLWVYLARAYAAVERRSKEDIARHGLTQAEFAVLEALYHKGPLLLGDVQRKILVSSGGITYLVDRLTEKGLVQRRPCPEDRRAIWAELTEDGRALMAAIFPEHAEAIREAVAGLDAAEIERASELLRKLGRAAAGTEDEAAGSPPA